MAKWYEVYNRYTVSAQAGLDFWQLLCDGRIEYFFKIREENTRALQKYRVWILDYWDKIV